MEKILLYEMKFLVPNYSCLQNPCLGGYPPPDPRSLCPLSSTKFVDPPPEKNSWVRHCTDVGFTSNKMRQSLYDRERKYCCNDIHFLHFHDCPIYKPTLLQELELYVRRGIFSYIMMALGVILVLFPVAAYLFVFIPVYCFAHTKQVFESCQASIFTALRTLMKVIVISGMTPYIITRFLEVFATFTFGSNVRTVFFLELEAVNTCETSLPLQKHT